jgi:hypothetical protein
MAYSPSENALVYTQQNSSFALPSTTRQTRDVYDWEYVFDSLMQEIRVMAVSMRVMRSEWIQQRLERQRDIQAMVNNSSGVLGRLEGE